MEEKSELSDIVLEKDDSTKSMKLKRILVIAAVLVLLFLAVLIIMRALNKPEQAEEARLILPPEPQSIQSSNEERLFQQVPIIEEEEKESFEDMVKKLKEKEMERSVESKQEPILEPKPSTEVTPRVAKIDPEPKPQQVATPSSKTKEPTTKSDLPNTQVDKNASSGIYVQVASVFKTNPDASYLNSLEKKGYAYRLYKTESNNQILTKVLIGPFANNDEARDALADIRRNLVEGAFIFRVP
ncbi:MAG: SPOR domain-containing protein [Campylobacteraceae bacterium]|nr:SPOR domain-containing protein [Campylobacteraceae bacterium]